MRNVDLFLGEGLIAGPADPALHGHPLDNDLLALEFDGLVYGFGANNLPRSNAATRLRDYPLSILRF